MDDYFGDADRLDNSDKASSLSSSDKSSSRKRIKISEQTDPNIFNTHTRGDDDDLDRQQKVLQQD